MENIDSMIKKYDSKKYYQNFKDKHNEIIKKKFTCELCGGKYTYFNKSHHLKTKKHLKTVENPQE